MKHNLEAFDFQVKFSEIGPFTRLTFLSSDSYFSQPTVTQDGEK